MAQTRNGNINPQNNDTQASQMQRPRTEQPQTGSRAMTPEPSGAIDRQRYGYASPFSFMQRFVNEMDRLFGGDYSVGNAFGTSWTPQMDIFERGGQLVVHADMPGLKPDDVRVNVSDGMLTISGERRHEHEHESGGVYQCERGYGTFRRTISLPEGVNADSVTASFDNGVLEVSMPAPQKTTQGRNVPIGKRTENPGIKH